MVLQQFRFFCKPFLVGASVFAWVFPRARDFITVLEWVGEVSNLAGLLLKSAPSAKSVKISDSDNGLLLKSAFLRQIGENQRFRRDSV